MELVCENVYIDHKVYIACNCTDLRREIDGLVGIVQQQFQLDQMVME